MNALHIRPMLLALSLLCSGFLGVTAHAQGAQTSPYATPLGGISLSQAPNVQLEAETLTISASEVRIEYVYRSYSDLPYDALISFGLPAVPNQISDISNGIRPPDWSQLSYETRINGQPTTLQYIEQAQANGRDISGDISWRGWSARWWDNPQIAAQIELLSPYQKARMSQQGLIVYNKADYSYYPAWKVKGYLLHQRRISAHEKLDIVHRYVPLLGIENGGPYSRNARALNPQITEDARSNYCMDDTFLAEIDRRDQISSRRGKPLHSVTRIGYLLSDSRNYSGVINSFEMTVDAGDTDRLVAFCMADIEIEDGRKWHVRQSNFQPSRNLDIVILSWPKLD